MAGAAENFVDLGMQQLVIEHGKTAAATVGGASLCERDVLAGRGADAARYLPGAINLRNEAIVVRAAVTLSG